MDRAISPCGPEQRCGDGSRQHHWDEAHSKADKKHAKNLDRAEKTNPACLEILKPHKEIDSNDCGTEAFRQHEALVEKLLGLKRENHGGNGRCDQVCYG